MNYRIEKDTMGEVKVPCDKYWGAQTERSYENFSIGIEKMPEEIIKAFAYLKKECAQANRDLGTISEEKSNAIIGVCDEIVNGKLAGNFPLAVWQTGSGTQTNMNVNEVIANRANEIAGKRLLHPNDDVNKSQSSNDTFPSAMNIAAVCAVENKLLPATEKLIATFEKLEKENVGVIKCGRTHLQDAVPIAFSQEISGWKGMVQKAAEQIKTALNGLKELAIGGTAVGTGLNAPANFGKEVAKRLNVALGTDFVSAQNKFYALSSKDGFVFAHGALKSLAADIMKIANDIRLMASGPRNGLGEIIIPANEPGSSIMPGKVNPTQCEAITMVAVQVMGNDATVGFAASQGNFELNVFMPVIAYNFLQSVNLLADGIISFEKNCVCGIKANKEKMEYNLNNSLMLATALNPIIGYENAAKTVKKAFAENITLKQACASLGFLTEEEFDAAVSPEKMV